MKSTLIIGVGVLVMFSSLPVVRMAYAVGPAPLEQDEPMIALLDGQRVFCALCGRKLDDTVTLYEVPVSEVVNVFDDGTHNDDVAWDGVPSNIKDNREEFIGPYCNALKKRLISYWDKIDQPDKWGYYSEASMPERWAPVSFYELFASTVDRNSTVEPIQVWDKRMVGFREEFYDWAIKEYLGYEVHEDRFAPIPKKGKGLDMDMSLYSEFGPMGPDGMKGVIFTSHPTSLYKGRAYRAGNEMGGRSLGKVADYQIGPD